MDASSDRNSFTHSGGQPLAIHWFRRDLRLHDNHALWRALSENDNVLPVFIFDTDILDKLDRDDRRVTLIHNVVVDLSARLRANDTSLLVEHGRPLEIWKTVLERFNVSAVYCAWDHEPYGKERDAQVAALLKEHDIPFHVVKDISIFDRDDVLKPSGGPYTVFTPYMKKWREHFSPSMADPFPSGEMMHKMWHTPLLPIPDIDALGFIPCDLPPTTTKLDSDILPTYEHARNIPAVHGTSRMSVALRFGLVSIRELIRTSWNKSTAFVNELIWREFFMMILHHFPHVAVRSFRPGYDHIPWRNNVEEFQRWCAGTTGYPLVDAGMRELDQSGFMHNRVRMVTASFLTKHLLIDPKWGEAWFAQKLLDFELSSNNGGWQWAAGSGCDAVPYFRVFNPSIQLQKFDPELKYVKHWVPEVGSKNYPAPIVVHKQARERALEVYKAALARS